MKILVIQGPNMNLLGTREPGVYGRMTPGELERALEQRAQALGVELRLFQSNSEAEIIRALHGARGDFDGVLMNPGGLSHYSVALRDAIKAVGLPVVEVHISNIFSREGFRSKSITGGAAAGVITGLGLEGYLLGLEALVSLARR